MDEQDKQPGAGQDWQELWNKNVSQIDDKLIELYKNASENVGNIADSARQKVHELLEKTDMDDKARAAWDKARQEGKELSGAVEERIRQLIADGRIAWGKWNKQDGDKQH